MNSLDAQCLILGLTRDQGCAPPLWLHGRDGSLGYRFGGNSNVSTWSADQVAEMAARWHAEGPQEREAVVTRMVEAHTAFAAIVRNGELDEPDVIVHDLDHEELRAVWDDARVHVVIDLDTGRPLADAS